MSLLKIIEVDSEKINNSVDLSPLRNKSILITGASGLIGTYFISSLNSYIKQTGAAVTLYAVVQSDPPEHLIQFLGQPGTTILKGDITDYNFLNSLPSTDFIIHAAGYGQPGKFMEDQIKTLKINTLPTFHLLEKIQPGGKFLFLSSSEVYSGLSTSPHKESEIGTTNTTHVRACYIEAKRCGEAICNAFRSKGVGAKSARLSLAYGPGTKRHDARAINNFIEKALSGKIELLDHGMALRTYVYITDAVEIMWNILLYGQDPVYNVGGKSRTTIKDLACMIGSCMGVPVTVPEADRAMEGAPVDVSLDMTKVEMEFKKTKYVSLEEGLQRTIAWQKELYNHKQ